ncbi:putative post-transcriptional gene silencing PAZ-Argonaute family [Rosa chinensis]|uniref:Putative post-transcriptional gene silencing PAZ-Argonaute family n=1 Tax=Rosa chinensis TaxID=74649 RepID=A0A2P6QGI8_ROSCH|nr:putative post-transcriptional gene silencing PAZ-Argonaute family [Rosa chinensis]
MSGRGGRGRHYSGARSNPSRGGGAGTQTPAYSPPAASSSSAPPVASLSSEMEQKLTLETTTDVAVVPPASSKAVSFPQRPNFGTVGKKIQVRANHFLVQVADRDVHHYNVTITPEVASKKIHREVINQLVCLYSETHLGKRIPAYDGMKSLYTAGPLPFSSQEFVVKLLPNDGRAAAAGSSTSSKRKDREFKVALTLANKPDLYQLQQFLCSQRVETPQEAIQVLDIVLRATPSEKYTVVGRSFFSTELGPKGSLGEGLEYWRGFYQSLRPTQLGLSLNIGIVLTIDHVFYVLSIIPTQKTKCSNSDPS